MHLIQIQLYDTPISPLLLHSPVTVRIRLVYTHNHTTPLLSPEISIYHPKSLQVNQYQVFMANNTHGTY